MKSIIYNFMYWSAILLSAGSLFVPLLCLVGYAAFPNNLLLAAAAVTGILYFLLKKPLHRLRIRYRNLVEYDEYGRSKTKGSYDYLSKQEKDRIDLQKTADTERILNSTAIKKMTKSGAQNPEEEMHQLIGLQPVKEKMQEMAARMQFEREEEKRKGKRAGGPPVNQSGYMSGRHMVFYGPPGTGKTTAAGILTGFLYQYGYIMENKYIEVDGNFLKSSTPGNTAVKTELVIREAIGGVLFIDEAYALMEGNDGYGEEAIATLIKQMEDQRGRFILILAGYTRNMKQLLSVNPGFESRIQEYLNFPPYTVPELKQIFLIMAKEKQFEVDETALDLLEIRLGKEMALPSFGNARTIRSILEESLSLHAVNWINHRISESDHYRLTSIDINTELQRKGI